MRHFPKISKYFKNILTLGHISTNYTPSEISGKPGGGRGNVGGGARGLTTAICDNIY